MNDSQIEVQQAIYEALAADWALSDIINGVYDTVPDGAPLPLITIGEFTSVDDSTMSIPGQNHTVTIHSWSEGESRLELKTIMAEVIRILHDQEITLGGSPQIHHLINIRWEFSETFKDPDGRTLHGVQRFRIVTDEDG